MLKVRKGFSLRKVLDTYLVIGVGKDAYIPNCIMSVNDTGAVIWDALLEGADAETLVEKIVDEFDVEPDAARADVLAFLDQLKSKTLIEEC